MKKTLTVLFTVFAVLILLSGDFMGAIPFVIVSILMYLNEYHNKDTVSWVVGLSAFMFIINLIADDPSPVDCILWVVNSVLFSTWKEIK